MLQSVTKSWMERLYTGLTNQQPVSRHSLMRRSSTFGDLHGIINNAGIIRDGMMAKKDRKTGGCQSDVQQQMASGHRCQLDRCISGSRAYAEWHIANGKKEGVIISVSSISKNGNQGQTNYSAAKAGLVAMTALWAGELGRYDPCWVRLRLDSLVHRS